MTDATDNTSCPPAHLEHTVAVFQRHAFAALLAGDRPLVAAIAETTSRDAVGVASAIIWLESHGRLERDGDHLVGAHGLTRRATAHTLVIGDRFLNTWCAYDAVAIPVALGATARAKTTCPTCHRALVIGIDAGRLPPAATPILWMPTGPCDHVIDDFCAQANLFCSEGHLDTWRQERGDPPGQMLTLADIPPLAHAAWGDVAS